MVVQRVRRISPTDLRLPAGKTTRLSHMLFEHGPGHGSLLVLPVDQGLEHGPTDFIAQPDSADPAFQIQLAIEGGYSAIAFHYGIAVRYLPPSAGTLPLILKINGKTNIPSDAHPFSSLTATVEDGVRVGADAIGYTLYVGSSRQDEDIRQLTEVRHECDRYGMPLVVWAYPRGEAIAAKGGRDSLYAIEYAARAALELGADIIKLNVPTFDQTSRERSPKPYDQLVPEYKEAVARVVRAAGRALVVFSGGSRVSDEDLLTKVRLVMEAGATGIIFGRNMWQRPMADALRLTKQIKAILLETTS